MIEIRVNEYEGWYHWMPFLLKVREKWKRAERLETKRTLDEAKHQASDGSKGDIKADTIAP